MTRKEMSLTAPSSASLASNTRVRVRVSAEPFTGFLSEFDKTWYDKTPDDLVIAAVRARLAGKMRRNGMDRLADQAGKLKLHLDRGGCGGPASSGHDRHPITVWACDHSHVRFDTAGEHNDEHNCEK